MAFHRYCADCGKFIDPLSLKVLQEGNRLFCDVRCHHHFFALPKKWNWFLPLYILAALALVCFGAYKAFGQVPAGAPLQFSGVICENFPAAEKLSVFQTDQVFIEHLKADKDCALVKGVPIVFRSQVLLRGRWHVFLAMVTRGEYQGTTLYVLATFTLKVGDPI